MANHPGIIETLNNPEDCYAINRMARATISCDFQSLSIFRLRGITFSETTRKALYLGPFLPEPAKASYSAF